jgi:putative ABC transport system permease protein
MRPDDRDLDDEIRGHLAINIKERIDRGEDPEAARRAALRELGYIPQVRESIRRVWYSRWYDAAEALVRDVRFAFRALRRAKGLTATVVVTLALGIGANAAIFSVVRGVLLRPLVNRDEDRLIYIRQSGPGLGVENMTFSVPEINDFKSRVRTIGAFGDFSTVGFTMIGLTSEPQQVKAGVVGGSFFEVMGLRPALGRLLTPQDDGREASPVAVLTHRFWTTSLNSDPSVIGKTIRLGGGNGTSVATIVGVLEPSIPYPTETQIIANMVTSPHHLGATMGTARTHRMSELFGRLAPGATLDAARAELTSVHAAMMRDHPEAYSARAAVRLGVRNLRDQIASPARTVLLLLLAAAAVVFVIASSNVANLILARSVRREGELALRAALGAGRAALRRTLLAESLVLCAAGAALGMIIVRPLVTLIAQYAARFSVRALEVTVDSSVLWVGAGLAMAAAVLLAYVPRLPNAATGFGLATGGVRITPATNRRLRVFATMQIALSFVLLAGAGMLLATLVARQTAHTGYNLRQVLAIDIPAPVALLDPDGNDRLVAYLQEAERRIGQLPGVNGVARGFTVPWRDERSPFEQQFAVTGYQAANGEENPFARLRSVSPRFFAVLGIPILAGRAFSDRDFHPEHEANREPVVIVSQSIAQRYFPNGDAVNGHVSWATLRASTGITPPPKTYRIVGVAADADDINLVPGPALTIYEPTQAGERLFVQAAGDPYALVPAVSRVIHELYADQAVDRPRTLQDVRAEVLAPDRVSAFVFSGFAGMALLIAVVGVAGVLAFQVSARTREFGVRLAIGATRRHVLVQVLSQGGLIAVIGIAAGAVASYGLARIAASWFEAVRLPGVFPTLGAAGVLIGAAILASLMPAARASRVDVLQALRSD